MLGSSGTGRTLMRWTWVALCLGMGLAGCKVSEGDGDFDFDDDDAAADAGPSQAGHSGKDAGPKKDTGVPDDDDGGSKPPPKTDGGTPMMGDSKLAELPHLIA